MIFAVKRLAPAAVLVWAAFGLCPPLAAQPSPHAVHGPRYGGAFATAASDTLHIEALWTEQRRLRVFVVDASGGPVPIDQLRDLNALVIAGDRESPLALLESDGYFEARIPTLTLPAVITMRLRPPAAAARDEVTFSFSGYTLDVLGLASASPAEIPGTLAGIVAALADDRRVVRAMVEQSEFSGLFALEERIRDRVLAIEPYLEPMPAAVRANAPAAIALVVRGCWLLHTVLDYGSADQRDAALSQLGEALDRLMAAVPGAAQ